MSSERAETARSPGKAALSAWVAATERVEEIDRQRDEAAREADALYREMVRLGREEGWHL
jgi:hypothetical protein